MHNEQDIYVFLSYQLQFHKILSFDEENPIFPRYFENATIIYAQFKHFYLYR